VRLRQGSTLVHSQRLAQALPPTCQWVRADDCKTARLDRGREAAGAPPARAWRLACRLAHHWRQPPRARLHACCVTVPPPASSSCAAEDISIPTAPTDHSTGLSIPRSACDAPAQAALELCQCRRTACRCSLAQPSCCAFQTWSVPSRLLAADAYLHTCRGICACSWPMGSETRIRMLRRCRDTM
jgi:hypothetical protein